MQINAVRFGILRGKSILFNLIILSKNQSKKDIKSINEVPLKSNGEVKRISDNYNHSSFTERFVQWMRIIAQK